MKKTNTPSFVLELEVGFSQKLLDKLRYDYDGKKSRAGTLSTLDKKCRAAVSIYNSALGEALKRLHILTHDPERKELLEKYRAVKDSGKTPAGFSERFKQVEERAGYSEYALHEWVAEPKHHFGGLIGIDEAQKLASRAFAAVDRILRGNAKRVRFMRGDDDITLEGKSGRSTLKYIGGCMIQFGSGNIYPLILKKNDRYAQAALQNRVKYVRLVRRTIRGKKRYFAQLILEGVPPRTKNLIYGKKDCRVGIDLGVSTAAIVSRKDVSLVELAPKCRINEKELRRLNRAIDRSRRASNPDNYDQDGTIKKGRLSWKTSKNCARLLKKRKELYRKAAAARRTSNNALANRIVALGTDVRVEAMNISGMAKRSGTPLKKKKNGRYASRKRYGKTILSRSPACLIAAIDRKLSYIGLSCGKVNTRTVKASQYDHMSNTYKKKPLGQRWHVFRDGTKAQRDLYSAFLIMNTDNTLEQVDRNRCRRNFAAFRKLHDREVERIRDAGTPGLAWYIA